MRKFFTTRNYLILVLILICLNLIYIDWNLYQQSQTPKVTTPVVNSSDCPNCSNKINNLDSKVNKLLEKAGITVTPAPTTAPVVSSPQVIQQPVSAVKEFYIPFGSGTGSYSDWTSIPGLQAYIDSTSYGNIKSVIFEASLHVPTGNETVGVRLINATDGRVIAGSELDFNGNSDSVLLNSQSLTLDYGNKLYQVQMKTQLAYPAILDQSRIHITTK